MRFEWDETGGKVDRNESMAERVMRAGENHWGSVSAKALFN